MGLMLYRCIPLLFLLCLWLKRALVLVSLPQLHISDLLRKLIFSVPSFIRVEWLVTRLRVRLDYFDGGGCWRNARIGGIDLGVVFGFVIFLCA